MRDDLFTWASKQRAAQPTPERRSPAHKGTRSGMEMGPRQKPVIPLATGRKFKISTHTFDTSSPLSSSTPGLLQGRFNNLFMLRDPGIIRRKSREPNFGRNRAAFGLVVGWALLYTLVAVLRG
jgi:hypothetical protein